MKTKDSFIFAACVAVALSACSSAPFHRGGDTTADALNAVRTRMDGLQAEVGKLTALLAKVEERTRP